MSVWRPTCCYIGGLKPDCRRLMLEGWLEARDMEAMISTCSRENVAKMLVLQGNCILVTSTSVVCNVKFGSA